MGKLKTNWFRKDVLSIYEEQYESLIEAYDLISANRFLDAQTKISGLLLKNADQITSLKKDQEIADVLQECYSMRVALEKNGDTEWRDRCREVYQAIKEVQNPSEAYDLYLEFCDQYMESAGYKEKDIKIKNNWKLLFTYTTSTDEIESVYYDTDIKAFRVICDDMMVMKYDNNDTVERLKSVVNRVGLLSTNLIHSTITPKIMNAINDLIETGSSYDKLCMTNLKRNICNMHPDYQEYKIHNEYVENEINTEDIDNANISQHME